VPFVHFIFHFNTPELFPELTDFNLFRGMGRLSVFFPAAQSRNCFTHRVIVERPTSIALAASASV
jgi:hypothetical protein